MDFTIMDRHRAFMFLCVAMAFLLMQSFMLCLATPVPIDSCRAWALRYNKALRVSDEVVQQNSYLRRAARGAYLPAIDFTGAYFYNQKSIHLVDVDNLRTLISGLGVSASLVAELLPDDFLELDTHNVALGAVTVVQPLYMGGRILALNDMAKCAEQLAHSQRNLTETEVVKLVDDAYWVVVSLEYKQQLAHSYVALVAKLYNDMTALITEGLATQSEGLAVAVAKNEADVMLTKAQNSLVLARMLLAQLCGLPLDTVLELQDVATTPIEPGLLEPYTLSDVYKRRPEVRSLHILCNMAHAQQRLALSSMLPSIAIVGMYSFATPNFYNGFQTSFDGMFSIGAMIQVPIFHWGTDYYRYKAARCAVTIANIELDATKERIALQVSEARYRYDEAGKVYRLCVNNSEQAQLNLRNAQYAFEEGVFTYTQLMAAQTAWRQAQSELIDARIAVSVTYDDYAKAVGLPFY